MTKYWFVLTLWLLSINEGKAAKCEDYTRHRNYRLLYRKPQCGQKNDGTLVAGRVLNGSRVGLGEFPWLIYIQVERKSDYDRYWNDTQICGGSLITRRFVLTSAQCVEIKDNYKIRATARVGEWWLANDGEDCDGDRCAPWAIDFEVDRIISHPGYDKNGHNDIALLRLWRNVTITDFVRPICLPLSCFWQERNLDCGDLTLGGWGDIQVKPWVVKANLPEKITVEVLNNAECQEVYKDWRTILESQFCAHRTPWQTPCEGDRGGPVQLEQWIRGRPTYYLMGVVSTVWPCSHKGVPYLPPHLFTRVTSYLKWILDTIQK